MPPIDPDRLLSLPPIVTEHSYQRRDTILYALGVGAHELAFVYEDQLLALPTMATILAYPGFFWRDPKYEVDWKSIVHGETRLSLHSALPVEGKVTGVTTLGPIIDKGADKGAIVYQKRRIADETGALLATVENTTLIRSGGGFGGPTVAQKRPRVLPEREPDHLLTLPTAPNQALLYRLSGDDNPLHIDPKVAANAGFEQPILHGLCTFGVVGRAILAQTCDNDPSALGRLEARFVRPVFPGESIQTEIWRGGPRAVSFRARVAERGIVVLDNGFAEFA